MTGIVKTEKKRLRHTDAVTANTNLHDTPRSASSQNWLIHIRGRHERESKPDVNLRDIPRNARSHRRAVPLLHLGLDGRPDLVSRIVVTVFTMVIAEALTVNALVIHKLIAFVKKTALTGFWVHIL